jgi:putative phosphoesterase
MQVGLLADSHGFLDEAIFTHFAKCDEVWHAGDFGPVEVLDRLKAFKPIRGVFGNIDGAEIRSELPQDLEWQCEGVRVYMTHMGGYPGHYDSRAGKKILELKPDLFICGHSHIARVMRDQNLKLLHMNPGACGRMGWHLKRTVLRFTVDGEKIGDVALIELGPRTSK